MHSPYAMEILPDGSFIGHARLGKFHGLTIVEYSVQGYAKHRTSREPVAIKGMRLLDESQYTGPKLRELRKERGVGKNRKKRT